MSTKNKATIEDLYHVPEDGKAEIVNGELVIMGPTGGLPGRAGLNIALSLRQYERKVGGRTYPDNVGFKANLPNRESFSPDAAFATGEPTMKFLEGYLFSVQTPYFSRGYDRGKPYFITFWRLFSICRQRNPLILQDPWVPGDAKQVPGGSPPLRRRGQKRGRLRPCGRREDGREAG